MVVKILITIVLCCYFIACESQKNSGNSGVVLRKFMHRDSITHLYDKQSIMPDFKVWYKDSLFIEEIKAVNIHTDTNGVTTMETPIDNYVFIDRRSKSFFVYRNFSDTAKIIDKYTQPDTAQIRGIGGWSFYAYRDMPLTEPPQSLNDTTIDGTIYKRYRLINSGSEYSPVAIGYFRCDKKGALFQIAKSLGEKVGCPMVRIDYLPTSQDPATISIRINFLSDSLTKEELKVFDAWERNAKNNPVK